MEDATYVDVDHAVPLVDAALGQRSDGHDAGIVHENVDAAEIFYCALDEVGDVDPFHHVDGIGLASPARSIDLCDDRVEPLAAAGAYRHDRPLGRQQLGRLRADPARSACDCDDCSFDVL
ncbi:hypothetical protein GCM10007858_41180 [Bradyrhizobium liaoningense]|nr:hypothetical protein GCM10007858_41180 [Bradyrhizobium liaoningense]